MPSKDDAAKKAAAEAAAAAEQARQAKKQQLSETISTLNTEITKLNKEIANYQKAAGLVGQAVGEINSAKSNVGTMSSNLSSEKIDNIAIGTVEIKDTSMALGKASSSAAAAQGNINSYVQQLKKKHNTLTSQYNAAVAEYNSL